MEKKKTSLLSRGAFKLVRRLVRLFYGKCEVAGLENLPPKNAIIVSNHAQMNGPIVGELFMPDNCYIWCAGQMMKLGEVPQYAYMDFWSRKPKRSRPFFKLLSYMIAPIASCLFNNARTIAVYRDNRIISTFRETVKMLADGKNILIFPEKDETHNNILYKLQENFIDAAKLYYRKEGVNLTFVPMYIAPTLRKIYIGKGITFDNSNDIAAERIKIVDYLSNEITQIARSLPLHTVVPYRNIKKKYYLSNRDITKVPNEKDRC